MEHWEAYRSTQNHRSCYSYCPTPRRSRDINADFYVRLHAPDPRLHPVNRYFRHRSLWARLQHVCLLRMPRSTAVPMATTMYASIIFLCGLLSKEDSRGIGKKDSPPRPSLMRNPWAGEGRHHVESAATARTSSDAGAPFSLLFANEAQYKSGHTSPSPENFTADLNTTPGCQGFAGGSRGPTTITTAILASCSQPLMISRKKETAVLASDPDVANKEVDFAKEVDVAKKVDVAKEVDVLSYSSKASEDEGGPVFTRSSDVLGGENQYAINIPKHVVSDKGEYNQNHPVRSWPRIMPYGSEHTNAASPITPEHTNMRENEAQARGRYLASAFGFPVEQEVISSVIPPRVTRSDTLEKPPSAGEDFSSKQPRLDWKRTASFEKTPRPASWNSPLGGHVVVSRPAAASRKVVFDDDSSSYANHVTLSPVELLSLLLVPEACV